MHSAANAALLHGTITRRFDGIICFGGEDWWYHNRGHFDMQMMREFSAHMPVVYINSIGMRMPALGEGRMFARRMSRKLRSLARGLHRIHDRFAVFSPLVAPAGLASRLTLPTLALQVRTVARRQRIYNPLLWVACPTAAPVVEHYAGAPLVYQRTDLYEQFQGVDPHRIRRCDLYLKARADLTIFCSPTLVAREAGQCQRAALIGHGVDVDRFAGQHAPKHDEPEEMRELKRPRVGFIGGIDAHTFDPEFFNAVVKELPDVQFVLVGGCSLPNGWCSEPNVTMLGRKTFDDIDRYMRACDVLIMPWKRNAWIEACNPVKLKEYLATGRPIVSTPFGALQRYRSLVHIAETPAQFAAAIRDTLADPGPASSRQSAIIGEGWRGKAHGVLRRLGSAGICAVNDVSLAPAVVNPALSSIDQIEVKPLVVDPPRTATAPAIQVQEANPVPARVKRPRLTSNESLAACILLSGGMQPSLLELVARRSVLDLWVSSTGTVLDNWLNHLHDLPGVRDGHTPVRVVSSPSKPPLWPRRAADVDLCFELEPRGFRGIAGLLHDLCRTYSDDAHVLIAESARYATCSIAPLWHEHVRSGADVTIGCNSDGELSGVYAIRCGCLRDVASIGFTDFKEQFLARAALNGQVVNTMALPGHGVMPLHGRMDWLTAAATARSASRAGNRTTESVGILASGTSYGLNVVCPGARVGSNVTLVDSVLMPGAVVENDTVVVRSVLCCGCRIQTETDIADAIAGPRGFLSDRERNVNSSVSPECVAPNGRLVKH